MKKERQPHTSSFLFDSKDAIDEQSIFMLNLYLSAIAEKPYTIDYNTLLMSFHLWKGSNIEEFCEKHTISYFLFNPQNDSAEAREAFFMDIREFLIGN
ncbi:hypothetical protein [Croceitalea rosinachiae]|uniref:Uncharacterized protein n=1 Tax=Croceitalea rosinachiae TaxID=3075596 RepID=A0ABU3AA06_9FLAO|nr:hypothetical protein [Croceitalea sp. F388]MDT0607031.1 hypothetical protein [Croceitalea sp. F388]